MLSVANVTLSKGRSYYQKENYYSQDSAKEFSQWHGKLAAELGLSGNVEFKNFDNLLFGYNPDGTTSIATNSVDPKKYEEPEITKKDRGNIEFSTRKICDTFNLKEEEYKKIKDVLDFNMRHNKKIKISESTTCLASINNVLKSSSLPSGERDKLFGTFEALVATITRGKERRGGYDLTFSAPKSISILGLVHGDKELLAAHRESVLKVLNYIEENYANTRTGDNIKREIENTRKLLIATFEHDTSRALDPQLHTHCVIMNLIKRFDGEWRSLHADDYRNYSKLFGMMYQNELAYRARELGYELDVKQNGTFEIKGVPQDLIEHFSKRRKQLLELGVTDQKSARTLVLIERAKKGKEIKREDLLVKWKEESNSFVKNLFSIKKQKNETRKNETKNNLIKEIEDSFSQSSEMKVGFRKEEALLHMIQNNIGKYKSEEFLELFNSKLASDLVPVSNDLFVTKEALKIEEDTKNIIELASEFKPFSSVKKIERLIEEKNTFTKKQKQEILNDLEKVIEKLNPLEKTKIKTLANENIDEKSRLSSEKSVDLKRAISTIINEQKMEQKEKRELKANINAIIGRATILTEGQKEAIQETLLSKEKNIVWLGVAGSGKTYSLATVVEQAKKSGYEVRGFAQNGDAASILSNETKMETQTIARLLLSPIPEENNTKKLWIIDEAGMVGAKLGLDLVKRAKAENARLIIVGDIRQLSSPTAGHFLKYITRYTNIKKIFLNKSLRQKNENLAHGVDILNKLELEKLDAQSYKKNAKELVEKALFYFNESISEFKSDNGRISHTVKEFLSMPEKERNKTIIVAKTHAAISEITKEIRDGLKNENYLKNEILAETYLPLNISEKQTKYAVNYEIGNVLVSEFKEDKFKLLERDKLYTIVKRDTLRNLIVVQDPRGKKIEFNPTLLTKKGVFQYKKQNISVAENDWMCWKKNIKNKGRLNKQSFKVVSIDHKKQTMLIKYEKGVEETVKLNEMNFMGHAWAVTYNASQGATKKNTIGIVEKSSSFEDIYTLFTRATHNLKVFVESKESLQKSLLKSGSKKTATELVRENKEKPLVMASQKMDFYDKHQKSIVFDKTKEGSSKTIISFVAPSDISALYFVSNDEVKKEILSVHKQSVLQAVSKFRELNDIKSDFKHDMSTKETIFDEEEKGFSKIQYIHSNYEITGLVDKAGKVTNFNTFSMIENQGVIKNLYQNFLAYNLKENGINLFNENEIIRVETRSDHVHALFSDHFERNMKILKCEKFSSPYEINKFVNEFPENSSLEEASKKLDWEKIKTDIENEVEKNYVQKNYQEIVVDSVFRVSKDLQIFDETKLYESVLIECKGNISTIDKIDSIYKDVLMSPEIKFLTYDRFGKMLFTHKDLSNEEANILKHSILRGEEKNHVLSFERVVRRADKRKYTENQIAALVHFTCDQGGVKFLSELKEPEIKPVLSDVKSLYLKSGYKVLNVYAGRNIHSELNNAKEDLHVRLLLEKIEEKRITLDNKTVIVLNDLGHNISKTSSKLFAYAEKSGAKIICLANENDFKADNSNKNEKEETQNKERLRFLKDLKRTISTSLSNRYKGILKQKETYARYSQNSLKNNLNKKIYTRVHNENLNPVIPEDKVRLLAIMSDVKEFYASQLFSEQGKQAREYMNKRGYTDEQLKEFGFGLSYTKGLEDFAKLKGYSKQDLITLSLMTQKEDGQTYDFYRNRIMIPINDEDGNCIGFGGRIYRQYEIDKKVSKYINPRKTVLFDKSVTLFGLDKAKESIKENKNVIVVEGYMDAIALQKAGVKNVVAVMGTALTDNNINKLALMTDNVTLLFDNDKAGKNAAKRSYVGSLQSDLKMSFASVSGGKDPDEFLRDHSVDEFYKDILNKKVGLDYFVNNSYLDNSDSLSPKNNVLSEWRKDILPGILSIDDVMKRNFELRSASLAFQTPLTELLETRQYKFLPVAFLTKEELEKRESFYKKRQNNNQAFNKFDNTVNSRNKIINLFRAEELRKGLIFEMNKIGLMDDSKGSIEQFILNNNSIYESVKNDIEYNEMFVLNKIENKHVIEAYKHLQEFYAGLSPQEISGKLFTENSSKEKEKLLDEQKLTSFFHFEKLKNSLDNGEHVSNEAQFFKPNTINFFLLKFANEQVDLLNDKVFTSIEDKLHFINEAISIEQFDKYLHFIRLPEEKKNQEISQTKIINEMNLIENNATRKRVFDFERELKSFIADKVVDKNNINPVFNEVRNVLIKESLFLDKNEKNSHKAYMNLADSKNSPIFMDIIKDIDISRIEKSQSSSILIEQKVVPEQKPNFEDKNLNNNILKSILEKKTIDFEKEEFIDDAFKKLTQKSGIKSSYNNTNSLNIYSDLHPRSISNDFENNKFNNIFEDNVFNNNDISHQVKKEIDMTKLKKRGLSL